MTTPICVAGAAATLWYAAVALGAPAPSSGAAALPAARFWEVVQVDGSELPWLHGATEAELAVVACRPTCQTIPWQLDERDAGGRLVADQGPEPNRDDPPGVLDGNDVVLFMAGDAAERAAPDALAPFDITAAAEIEVSDPATARRAWVYLLRVHGAAPRSAATYVRYDPAGDRIEGARVALGFTQGTPRFLALTRHDDRPPENLLDRMKIRATARLLWGLVAITRTEDDLHTQFVAWRQGPIRVIRRQRSWVRLGWGLRTPIFGSDTYFYRDYAELPVSLRLNFPPRLLFTDVLIRAVLDFRNLSGWEVETPGAPRRLRVDGHMTADKRALARQPGEWFALHGPDVTLVELMTVSPSLNTVRRRLVYREDADIEDPPETERGEMPGIGYTLSQWEQVASGPHWFASNSFALPPEQDVAEFIATRQQPLRVTVRKKRG